MARKNILNRRKFIDTIDNADSYIKSEISKWHDEHAYHLDAELGLADCYKKITWNFSVYGREEKALKKDIKHVRKKMDNVRKMFDEFFTALENEIDEIENTAFVSPLPPKE